MSNPIPEEPLWRHVVGDVLRRERLAQRRTLKDVAEAARISMPYLSEIERGRKEASSEVLAAAARALGLGLAGLLDRARTDLARAAGARPVGARTVPGRVAVAVGGGSAVSELHVRRAGTGTAPRPDARRNGLCLAA
ncbi:helix-turn-helix domain-containing protein [Streptomyces sp. NPDC016309]|uniref:helix-turn-helix domain-containing protein n=1 Tax=Streptomyces sp. NPDC016309 TaxID=3364965 RepID=UPI0036F7271D